MLEKKLNISHCNNNIGTFMYNSKDVLQNCRMLNSNMNFINTQSAKNAIIQNVLDICLPFSQYQQATRSFESVPIPTQSTVTFKSEYSNKFRSASYKWTKVTTTNQHDSIFIIQPKPYKQVLIMKQYKNTIQVLNRPACIQHLPGNDYSENIQLKCQS